MPSLSQSPKLFHAAAAVLLAVADVSVTVHEGGLAFGWDFIFPSNCLFRVPQCPELASLCLSNGQTQLVRFSPWVKRCLRAPEALGSCLHTLRSLSVL